MCKKENVFTIRSTSWEEEADEEKEEEKIMVWRSQFLFTNLIRNGAALPQRNSTKKDEDEERRNKSKRRRRRKIYFPHAQLNVKCLNKHKQKIYNIYWNK